MNPTCRVIVFLLEGFSDKQALEYPVSLFLDNVNDALIPEFLYPPFDKGDITGNAQVDQKNILKAIPDWWDIENYLNINGLSLEDVAEIIQIIDIDGVYLDDERIIYSPVVKIKYYPDRIVCNNRNRIIDRNLHKRHSIANLKNKKSITINGITIPYSLYFFSCNIDQFTCDNQNLPHDQKVEKANEFSDRFETANEFVNFFLSDKNSCSSSFTYEESWKHLKSVTDKIEYSSNFHILLKHLEDSYKNICFDKQSSDSDNI